MAAKLEEAEERAVVEVEVEVVAAGVAAAAAVARVGLLHQLVLSWSDGPQLALGTPVKALVRERRSRTKNPVLLSLQPINEPPRWLHALPSARLRLHSPLRPQLHSTARGPDVPPRPSAGKVDEHL